MDSENQYPSHKKGSNNICKNCHNLRVKEWIKNNPEKWDKYNRKTTLLSRYGISSKEYEELFRIQEGRCAICGSKEPGGKFKYLNIDHNHETGMIRGLLCMFCNTGLGKFRDDPSLLEKAAKYLKEKT